jgi:c-di-GMP-binding flagellar brake protein YcgR
MIQRREHERIDVKMSAEVRTASHSFTATTRNLSVGGCCLESSYPLAEESELRLDLFVVVDGIEDERMPPLTVAGTVQWSAESDEASVHLAGVKFSAITAAQTKWLEQFIARTGHE